ncbi:MAG: hypothetical protein KTR13_07530 [Saprospiraceae bacterium]|nr:hypothetical protein [Saprospiraceae bacterium]
MSTKNVESILPLSFSQSMLLLHHLQAEVDEGFLCIEGRVEGNIDQQAFSEAWQKTTERHSILRTSIHWENIDKQVQVTRSTARIQVEYLDWSAQSDKELEEAFNAFKKDISSEKLPLTAAPISKVYLIQVEQKAYKLIWISHHIIMDGWSSANILKDVFGIYNSIQTGESFSEAPLPSLLDYHSTLNHINREPVKSYWQNQLVDFEAPSLIASKGMQYEFNSLKQVLSKANLQHIRDYCLNHKITLNTFFQGMWFLLLSKRFQRAKVVLGSIVSGRTVPLSGIEKMAGLFTNKVPVISEVQSEQLLSTYLKAHQKEQLTLQNYEFVDFGEISEWVNWKGNPALFDTILIVQNFPAPVLNYDSVRFSNFKSGITSTYPITASIIPQEELTIQIKFNKALVSTEEIQWFMNNLNQLLTTNFSEEKPSSYYLDQIAPFQQQQTTQQDSGILIPFNPPVNQTELELSKIWQSVLNIESISTTANFFELGGKSLHAVRMLSQVQRVFGQAISPASFLKQPTIKALVSALESESGLEAWASLVPLKINGSAHPLYCIHAGGAHVFMYNTFSNLMPENQPVYGIQPKGLDGLEDPHTSIEEMASDYIAEMRSVQTEGQLHLLAYCFSTAVVLEIARQEITNNQPHPLIFIVDSGANPWYLKQRNDKKEKFKQVVHAVTSGSFNQLSRMIGKRLSPKAVPANDEFQDEEGIPEALKQALVHSYQTYHWTPIEGKVILIRSSEFSNRSDKNYHLEAWNELAQGGCEVFVVDGKHKTLFEPPNVVGLAQQVLSCLNDGNA